MANDVEVRIIYTDKESADRLVKNAGKKGGEAGKNFGSGFSNAVSTALGIGIFKAVGSAINGFKRQIGGVVDASRKLEVIETQFKTILGSTTQAQKQLKELQQFASTTPFQIEGLSNATRQLLSFGVAQEQVIPTLQRIGDIASGVGANIDDLTIPYGRLISTQKLTLVELDKFADRGVNLYGKLSKQTGISLKNIRDEISKGRVPFKEFTKAIEDLTNKGGMFFGGMQAQSKTLSGVISTLKDNFFNLQGTIGNLFKPILVAIITKITAGVKALTDRIADLTKNNAKINELTQTIFGIGQTIINYVIKPMEMLYNITKVVINFLGFAFVKGAQAIGQMASALEDVTGIFSHFYRIGVFVINAIKTGFKTLGLGALTAVEAILSAMNTFKDMSGPLASVRQAQDDLFNSMAESADDTGKAFKDMWSKFGESRDDVKGAFTEFNEITDEGLAYFAENFTSSLGNVFGEGFSQEMLMANENFRAFLNQMLEDQGEAIDGMKDKGQQPATEVVEQSKYATESIMGMWDSLNVSMSTSAKTFENTSKAITNTIRNGLAKGISGGIQHIVKNVMAGKDAFANFGKFVMATMGDMAIQMGNQLILSGIGIESLKTLGGSSAIVAGAGLVALGTIMKSLGGGAGGGGASGSPSGGTFDPVNTTTALEDDIAEPDAIQEAGPRVALTIEGNVFDTDDTRKSIVNFLNEEFSESGANLENASFA